MRYMRVEWRHSHPNEPVTLYSEVDDDGYELRKVEVFRDGHVGFASPNEKLGGTELGEKPIPSIAEIAADSEFQPSAITQDEFERAWSRRSSSKAWTKTG